MVLVSLLIFVVLLLIFLGNFIMDFIKRRKSETKYHLRETILAFVLLAPAVLLTFFFVLLPIFFSLGYAFTDFDLLKPLEINPVGFKNFITIFTEYKEHLAIYSAVKNTLFFVFLVVPIQITLALLLALFCNNKRRGTIVFKICFFAPVAISLTVASFFWLTLLSPADDGIMNTVLSYFGISAHDFLGNKDTVMIWIVIISAWQGCGYQMLIFLSALGNIRKDLYEAASIDGANVFQRFFTITLPGLRPTFLYILITVFVGACRVMIQPMILTGYDTNSLTMSYFMYVRAFDDGHIGESCTVALMMTILIGAITFVQRKLLGEKKK